VLYLWSEFSWSAVSSLPQRNRPEILCTPNLCFKALNINYSNDSSSYCNILFFALWTKILTPFLFFLVHPAGVSLWKPLDVRSTSTRARFSLVNSCDKFSRSHPQASYMLVSVPLIEWNGVTGFLFCAVRSTSFRFLLLSSHASDDTQLHGSPPRLLWISVSS